MGCISKQILNDESGLRRIKRWINHRPDWEQQIRDTYENAEDIIRILKSKGENISLADLSINDSPKQQEQIKSVNQFAVKDVSIDVNYGGDKAALDRMIRNFRNRILNSSIYNMSTGTMIKANLKVAGSEFSNVLNRNIYNYKVELVNTIWNLVNKGKKTVFESPYVFINEMNEALAAYSNYKGDINSDEYRAARDAYSILKNFDSLLEQQASFIKVNKKYSSINEAYDKYIYEGANTDMFKTWTTKEDVDIEGQISDLVSTIIESFPKYNKLGQPMWDTGISIPEYNKTMSAFKSWITSGMTASDLNIHGANAEEIFKQFKNAIFRIGINTSEDAKIANERLKTAFTAFVNKAKDGQISQVDSGVVQGINAIFKSGLDQQIKNAMLNLMFKTDENRGIITSTFNNTISNRNIQENYISRAVYQVQDSINSAISKFKWDSPQSYKNLQAKYGIKVDPNNHDKIYIGKYNLTLIYKPNGDVEVIGKIGNNIAAQIITDILNLNLPSNYNDILIQMRGYNKYAGALFDQFKNAIGIVLFASDPDAINSTINDEKNWINGNSDPLRSTFNIRIFSAGLQPASELLGIGWGINISSTQRNSFGNNIAAYTLTSLINQMGRHVLNMERKPNSIFKDTSVYKEFFTHVGKPFSRIDVNINGNKKAARDLTVNELAITGILYDFFKNYKKFASKASQYIYFQNSCFSDKNTHWVIPYHKDFKLDSKNTLGSALDFIFDSDKHAEGVQIFMDSIFNSRKSEYSKIFNNISNDYITAFNHLVELNESIPEAIKSDVNNLKSADLEKKLNALRNISNYVSNKKDFMEKIKSIFAANKLDFTEELHYSKNGFNETLDHDIQMYVLDSTKAKFKARIQQQEELFVKYLRDYDFSFNNDIDKETYDQVKTTIGDEWFDENQEMIIVKDKKLNPLLEAYYLSDILLSNGYNDLLFGKTFFHPNKYYPTKEELDIKNKTGKWPESYFIRSEASRLSSSYKRTVIAGATTHTFFPDKFGVSSDINFAVLEDYKADPYNMSGVTSGGIDAMDGSGWSSPIQSLLENMSLLDAKVGWDKKTIFGDVDPKTGCPTLLKWAVYALTNERRRNSECSVISANNMFKKMHNIPFNKRIDINKYYNPGKGINTSVNGRKISEDNWIYYQDVETGNVFRIDRLEQDQDNMVHIFESRVDSTLKPVGNSYERRKVHLNTINAIDEIFGGAYAMQKDEDSGKLVWSDVNNKLCANIICNEDLKQNMIAYAVNKSAIKVGARNINLRSSWTDNSDLLYTNMSLVFGGVQMDADHVLGDDTDVTEMSQMISSLIQSGLSKEQAIDIFKDIGDVVAESLKNKNYLVYNGDYSAVHEMLGREFIKSFSKGNKDTMGLAQSYLIKASQELAKDPKAKVNIPFSDPTVLGAFTSNVASEINKRGIKRKYAGIASVQVPSRGMIQYFNYDGEKMLYPALAKKLRNRQFTAKQYITTQRYNSETGQFEIYGLNRNGDLATEIHPFIKKINPWELDMGDTVIIVKNGVASNPIVLDDWPNYDTIKHLTDGTLYKWSIRPVDLRQSDITIEVNGKRYSIYDLDSVRSTHYIKDLIKNKQTYLDLTPEKKLVVNNVIGEANTNDLVGLLKLARAKVDEDLKLLNTGHLIGRNSAFGDIIGRKYRSFISSDGTIKSIEDLIIANNNIDNREQLFEDIIANSKNINVVQLLKRITQEFNIDPKEFTSNYTKYSLERENRHNFSNLNVRFAEIITGKINKIQLGLRDDDSISDIKDASFFINRIKEEETLIDDNIDKDSYDAVLKGVKGENLYVRISPLHTITDAITGEKIPEPIPGWSVNNSTFSIIDGNVYYKDKLLCTADGKQFYTQPGITNVNNMVVLESIDQLKELLDSDLFNRVEYNYNKNNLNAILQYRGYINDEGIVKNTIKFHQRPNNYKSPIEANRLRLRYIVKNRIDVGTDISTLDIKSFIDDLNQEVAYEKDRDIKQIAYNRFNAFKRQLEVIGARIPTQSMQSYMGLRVVAFTNSIYNEVYIPAAMAWLEGSDYDIDKLYMMGYELNSKGSFIGFSRLLNDALSQQEFEDILNLPKPNGVKYVIGEDSDNGLSAIDVLSVISDSEQRDYTILGSIMNTDSDQVHFKPEVSKSERYRFLNILNKHSQTKLSDYNKEAALRNSVVYKINTLLRNVRLAPFAHKSVDDSMEMFRNVAKKSMLAATELSLSSDNPLVKFLMQTQNMVGKDVIGITAVGMKVFFGVTTAFNQIITNLVNHIKTKNFVDAQLDFQDLLFKDPISGQDITIANLNFEPLLELLDNLSDEDKVEVNNALGDYLSELPRIIEQSQHTDAAEAISGLLSAATDNAKELILAKINATADFADAWTYLISTGRTPEEISEIMMSPIFSVVQKYSHSNLFSTIGLTNSKKTAIEFVLGLKQLSGINLRDLKLIVGAYRGKNLDWDNKCFIDKLLYETEKGEIKLDKAGNPIKRQEKLIDDIYLNSEDGIFAEGSNVRKNMFNLFSDVNNPAHSTRIAEILLEHIDYLRKHSSEYKINPEEPNYDPDLNEDYDNNEEENSYENSYYQDQEFELESDELSDEENNQINNSDFGSDINIKVNLNSLNSIRRYISKYVIPKNKQILEIYEKDPESISVLIDFYNNILPAVEEQTILGSMLGVNQGIKSKLSDFIGTLKRTENFVNSRIPKVQNEPLYEPFNIIKFLEDEDYKQEWIKIYSNMKSYNNILKTISEVPNFAAMYKQNALTYRLESHAARNKINIKLEKAILEYNKSGSSATRKLTGDEWNIMDKYTRDLILLNWLLTQNISFSVPSDQDFYDNGVLTSAKDDIDINGNIVHDHSGARLIKLNTFSGQASFVRYFENTLFDILKQRYANDEDKKAFFNNVVISPDFSKVYNQKTHHLKLTINSMIADKNQGLKTIYSEILKAFNNLSTEKIPELNNMTFGDALFIYNSLVYKNAFTEKGFTRLFESLVFDENSIINSYVNFLSDLDSNTIDTGSANDLDSDLEINENGTFTWGMIKGNINDFLRRLAFNQVSANKFGVALDKDSEKSTTDLKFQDMFGRPVVNEYGMEKPSIYIGVSNANDWTSEMPCMTQDFEDNNTFSYESNYNQPNCYRWNSEVVIRAIISDLAKRLNLTVGEDSNSDIILFDSNKLPSWVEYNNGAESPVDYKNFTDYIRIMRSSAFINNGKIYINTNKMNVDTTVHELMHVFCANLKFSKDEALQDKYYKAIEAANNLYKTKMRKEYRDMLEQYDGDYGSDFKEELLVKLMSDQFTHAFRSVFGAQKWVDDIKEEILNTINQIFATNISEDINIKKLGDTRLSDFLQAFNSKLFDTDGNNLLANMQLDQELKTIKRILIKNSEDPTKNSKIEYNC